jgi:hypothetical protein
MSLSWLRGSLPILQRTRILSHPNAAGNPSSRPAPRMNETREMGAGLYALLRFLQHELAQWLEHVDLRLEGIEELDAEGREVALEVSHALLEAMELTKGYVLDAFTLVCVAKAEIAEMPSPAGERTLAVLRLTPAENARALMGLGPDEQILFDGVFTYLERSALPPKLWMEVGETGPIRPSKLPVV